MENRDEQLIKSFMEYFGAGGVYVSNEAVDFIIQRFEDLTTKVIPFFAKYPVVGIKALDFADWCKAAELIKNKAHLTIFYKIKNEFLLLFFIL